MSAETWQGGGAAQRNTKTVSKLSSGQDAWFNSNKRMYYWLGQYVCWQLVKPEWQVSVYFFVAEFQAAEL